MLVARERERLIFLHFVLERRRENGCTSFEKCIIRDPETITPSFWKLKPWAEVSRWLRFSNDNKLHAILWGFVWRDGGTLAVPGVFLKWILTAFWLRCIFYVWKSIRKLNKHANLRKLNYWHGINNTLKSTRSVAAAQDEIRRWLRRNFYESKTH